MPTKILEALLPKSKIAGCLLINATPYDACIETVCLRWHETNPKLRIHHLSVSQQPHLVDYVQKKLALQLLKAHMPKSPTESILIITNYLLLAMVQYLFFQIMSIVTMGLNLFLEGNWCIEFWAITIQVIHVALASSCYEVLRSHVKSDKCHSVASAC